MGIVRCFVVLGLVASLSAARADSTPKDPAHCASMMLIVTGLGAGDGLEAGGDIDNLLVHEGEGATSRYWVFTSAGQFSVQKPWPKNGPVGFVVKGADKPRHFAWYLKNGSVASQSTQTVAATVTADKFVPLDGAGWKILERIVAAKAPRLIVQLKEQRESASLKHMPFHMANGWAESFDLCIGLPGEGGKRLGAIASAEKAKFDALAKTPVEPAKYEVVKRADHAEWRKCASKADCVVAGGPCGAADVIAKIAKKDYASWAKTRTDQINCDQIEDDKPAIACEANQCVDTKAAPKPAWSACKADADCVVDLSCDTPIAVNKKILGEDGYNIWKWFRTVDAWDRCSELSEPKPGRCAAGKCAAK